MRKSGKLAKKGFSCVQVHPFSQEDLDDKSVEIFQNSTLSQVQNKLYAVHVEYLLLIYVPSKFTTEKITAWKMNLNTPNIS